MLYFAHRGASALAVENTVPAFEKAHALGACCYELDVHLTADGQVAVHHDYSLLSTAGVDVRIGCLTAAELKKIPLKNSFSADFVSVPLLHEVLPVVLPGLGLLNVELKNEGNRYPGLEQKLLAQLQPYPQISSKILFSSFEVSSLQRLRQLDKTARIGLLTRHFDLPQPLTLGAESVHLNHTRFSPQIAARCHQNGLKVYVYTVNDLALAARLQAQGADGIFTDFVHLFI